MTRPINGLAVNVGNNEGYVTCLPLTFLSFTITGYAERLAVADVTGKEIAVPDMTARWLLRPYAQPAIWHSMAELCLFLRISASCNA